MDRHKNRRRSTLILGAAGMLAIFGVVVYILSTTGFWGLIKWEISYRIYVIAIAAVGLLVGVFAFFAKGRGASVISRAVSVLAVVIAVTLAGLVFSFGTGAPEKPVNLNFYTSQSAPLSNEKKLSVAIITDTHWGGSNVVSDRRAAILDAVENGGYDLLTVGGDVVDLGCIKSYYDEATSDLEKYVPTTPIHFLMGNHDALINSAQTFRRYFQPEETSFNHVLELAPGVHWVVFNLLWDESDISAADLDWLDKTLAAYDEGDTVIVQAHGFPYASGNVSSGGGKWYDIPGVIERVVPILEKHGVDLMISGHQHSTEFMEKNGVYYALVPTAAKPSRNKITVETAANQLFFVGKMQGYLSVDIDGGLITVSYISYDGILFYTHEIKAD